jgi:hypothetical protein
MGQQIYYVFEETDWCMRMCCSNNREFTLHVVNNYNQVISHIIILLLLVYSTHSYDVHERTQTRLSNEYYSHSLEGVTRL